MMRNILKLLTLILLASLSALASAAPFGPYNNTTGQAIPDSSCGGGEIVKTFNVTDDFTVDDLNVGFNATHPYRSVVRVSLQGPNSPAELVIKNNANNGGTDYDILLDDASANDPNSGAGGAHNTAAPLYDVTVDALPNGNLTAFNGENALGTWTMRICDVDAFGDNGTFNSARLIFDGTATPTVIAPTLTKAFSPASIVQGNNSTITFTISNSNAAVALTGMVFTDNMPAAIDLASTTLGGTCTGFTVTSGVAGDSSFTLGGGSLAANSSCTVTTIVTGTAAGVHANTASGVNSNETSIGADSNTANLTVIGPATIAKAFTPASMVSTGTSVLSFTLTNPNSTPLTGIAFTDPMPVEITLSNGVVGGTCTGVSVDAGTIAGSNNIAVTSGTVPANSSCSIDFTVTSASLGVHDNTASGVNSTESGLGAVSNTDSLTVTAAVPTTIAKSFNGASISSGITSVLRFTLNNSNAIALTNINFTDAMPAAITLSNASVGGSCTGVAVDAATIAGSSNIAVTSGTVPANSSCTIDFTVTSSTVGVHNNTSSGVSSSQTGIGSASNTASLTVTPAAVSIVKAFSPAAIQADETTTVSFTLTNPNGTGLTGVNFTDSMPSTIWLDSTTLGGSCSGFVLTGGLGDSSLSFANGSIPANSSCTIDLTVRSNVVGSHNNTTSGVSSNEAATGPASNTAQLSVSTSPSAVCTPGDLGGGSINYSNGNQLFSLNLATGKVEPLTTVPAGNVPSGIINSVAVDPRNYIIYYMDNTGANTNRSIFGYDMLSDTHFTVEADVTTNHGLTLGNRGLGSGGGSFFGGSLYLGIEDRPAASDEVVFRLQMSDDGRSVRYAQEILTLPAGTEFGDLVVTGSDLLIFDAGNDQYRRFDLATLTLQTTAGPNAVYSQGGAQRDGSTMWTVSNVIQQLTIATGALLGTPLTLTTDGTTAAGSAADSGGCVPTTSRIGDLVWNDSNLDGVKDNTEIGIGNVTLDLYYDLNGDGVLTAADDITGDNALTAADRIQTTTTASDGSYFFNNLVPDDYLVDVTDVNNILGGATPTNGVADPRAATNLATNEERNGIDFGYSSFIVLQGGNVFNDNGAGGGTAHDGIKQVGEAGFEGVSVRALDPGNGNAVITSTLTDPNGAYTLYIPNSFAGNPVEIVVDTISGHLSVSENVSTTGATNTDTRNDSITFTPVAGSVHSDVNFGDVPQNTFVPDNTGSAQPGQVVFYAHRYTAGTAGSVSFSSVGLDTPTGLAWNHVIYRDSDCSGDLNGSEASGAFSGSLALLAGDEVCLINQVVAPTSAPFNSQYLVTLTADFAYTGETPDGLTAQHVVNDLTTLAVVGLTLDKTVQNIGINDLSPAGSVGTSNEALPNERLRYSITFTNNGNNDVNTLVIRDTVPPYTSLDVPVACPGVLPNNLSACSVVVPAAIDNVAGYQGAIEWGFTGGLVAGQSGTLQFDVRVE